MQYPKQKVEIELKHENRVLYSKGKRKITNEKWGLEGLENNKSNFKCFL